MEWSLVLSAVFIFLLRMADVTLGTLRTLVIFRGYRLLSWFMSFGQSLIFVIAVRQVIVSAQSWMEILAYAAGYATGTVLGIWLEGRLALGYSYVRIVSPHKATRLAEALRSEGFAVTEISGRGLQGTVGVLECAVPRRQVNDVLNIAKEIDPKAFITVEEIRPPMRGHFRA